MRLTSFSAQNYLSHRGLNIVVDDSARVLVVAGPNGVGKTAIAQGIRLAMTGEPTRGLTYKKDLAQLITQGETSGAVFIEVFDSGSQFDYSTNLKTAAHFGPPASDVTISLSPEDFFAMDATARRRLLFNMAGLTLDREAVATALVAKGHERARVDRAAQFLRLGFAQAADEARSAATEARGAWKAVTGETYGEVKAATWKAPKPASVAGGVSLEELRAEVERCRATFKERTDRRDTVRDTVSQWKGADVLLRARDALPANEKALADAIGARREQAEKYAKLPPPPPEPKGKGEAAAHCPACGVALAYAPDGELIEWDESVPEDSGAAEARASYARERQELEDRNAEVARLEFAVSAGRQAQAAIEKLPKMVTEKQAADAERDVGSAAAALALAENELAAAERAANAIRDAEQTTTRAARHHADVLAYSALAEAIVALPAEYLATTLTEVNGHTTGMSTQAGFDKPVTIGEDMEVRYGSIAYPLASTSQQWRARAAVGYALARMSGLDLLVLDEFDVVEPACRGAILKFFALADEFQTVLCATLKQPPKLPEPPFQVCWIGGQP